MKRGMFVMVKLCLKRCGRKQPILYFLEKGAQLTRTIDDILRKAEFFKEKERTLS
ncbi:hypothetical protein ZWY2020_007726 [Hordeum vulgare]|nr:hypothetical protein ZWY2020_007726 [Hordeum vulgare]